jgi:hypothetical protein
MKIIQLNIQSDVYLETKTVELIKVNNKYYIELENYDNINCIVQLSVSIAKENEILKERIAILENKIALCRT